MDETGIVVGCVACGQRNRIPFAHLGETGICGKCKDEIPPLSEPIEVESEVQFANLIRDSRLPVLVDFWAAWCGPCRMMAPEYAKAAQSLAGEAVAVKVNSEAVPGLAARYQVGSLPTLALFANGREAARDMGSRPAAAIVSFARSAAQTAKA